MPLLDGCAVVTYDHRGNGRSARPPLSTMTIEQLADDAAALVARLGLARPAVIGHSFGGFVAQELALRHPDAVGALVLVATGPGQLGTGEDPPRAKAPPLPAAAAAVMSRCRRTTPRSPRRRSGCCRTTSTADRRTRSPR